MLQRVAKIFEPIAGVLGILRDLSERGALLSGRLQGHGAVKILKIVFLVDSVGTATDNTAGTSAHHAASAATTTMLREHCADWLEERFRQSLSLVSAYCTDTESIDAERWKHHEQICQEVEFLGDNTRSPNTFYDWN